MSALVICAGGGIGDVLLATPVMRTLRARYGSVVALTTAAHRDVLAGNADLAEVWSDDVPFGGLVARVRARRFEASVTTWATLGSAALPFLAGIPARAGQARRTYSPLFTHRVVVRSERGDRTTHWTQILLDFPRALGCTVTDARPVFTVPAAARASLRALLAARDVRAPYLVLHPTRGIAAARERWPVRALGDLARALGAAYGVPVVVTGGGGDKRIADAVAAAAGAISLGGATTIPEFGALAEGALGVVAMDSGPMHVAAAVGAPTVGIFALRSDKPDRWGPQGRATAIVRGTYPCPPHHRKETCPDFACIAALPEGRIVDAVDGVLGRVAEARPS